MLHATSLREYKRDDLIYPIVFGELRFAIKMPLKVNVSGLKFNDPEMVSLFVRDNQHIPAVPSHYKLIYICNMRMQQTHRWKRITIIPEAQVSLASTAAEASINNNYQLLFSDHELS